MIIEDSLAENLCTTTMRSIEKIEHLFDELGNPYFFPEYTVHGKQHVEKVLYYASQILAVDSLAALKNTSKCMDVLVLAICLHDLGMFITKDGFDNLLKDPVWKEHFIEFIDTLKYADGDELDRIFGAVLKEAPHRDEVERRRLDMFNPHNIFTVGEFLRKYHHELAHYIAVNGFPTDGEPQRLIEKDGYEDVIGYVAKAHRGKIRELMQELEKSGVTGRYQKYCIRKIPVAFLMSVIWVADEIDDKSDYRAPMLREELFGVRNAFSQQQWADNRCVLEPTINLDMSLIYIDAAPISTTQYLRIDEYCKKVQDAIDKSWVALSEYYGKSYELSIFRVESKIYELQNFDFLAADVSLRVNPQIIEHLVRPLYDNNPAYGVRELLSNAIDACREREVLDSNYTGKAKITCTLDAYLNKFIIEDNGIGMTADVIIDYFMTVGKSFREGKYWKRNFAPQDGNGKVGRFGRFGIGVLAAFLLGDEIEVTTRHWQDTSGKGYHYVMHLDGKCPDVDRVDCDFGTSITITAPSLVSDDKTVNASPLFAEYIKYHYGIPHYSFEYPQCLYKVHSANNCISVDEVYYYTSTNPIEVKQYDTYDLKIGSILEVEHYSVKSRLNEHGCHFEDVLIRETSEKIGNYYFSNYPLSSSYSTKTQVRKNANGFPFPRIEKIFYNGMSLRMNEQIEQENQLISDANCTPLYVNIIDRSFVTALNLQKTYILDCDVMDSIIRFHGFLLVMYPLTLDVDSLKDLLNKYPYDDKVKRDESLEPIKTVFGDNEFSRDRLFREMPIIKSDEFIFAYDVDYYLAHKNENFLTRHMYDAIIEWLEVAPGYEQNYEIPYDIEERKRKFVKAFAELEKYISPFEKAD
jgi:hypothetical protein